MFKFEVKFQGYLTMIFVHLLITGNSRYTQVRYNELVVLRNSSYNKLNLGPEDFVITGVQIAFIKFLVQSILSN